MPAWYPAEWEVRAAEGMTRVAPDSPEYWLLAGEGRHLRKDYVGARAAYGFAVAKAVASPAVKVLYDIYHMSRMGEDVVADITGNLDLIAHLHTAEMPRRSIPRQQGAIAYGKIVPAVMKAGYQGFWGTEFVVQGDVMTELREAVKTFV